MPHNVHANRDNHHILIPTDLTITTERLTELFQSLEDTDEPADFTVSIGEQLHLPQSAIEEINKRYQSKAKRKEAYLDTYAHHHPCPSWKRISEILRMCVLYQQAREVENIYVQGILACTFMIYLIIKIFAFFAPCSPG